MTADPVVDPTRQFRTTADTPAGSLTVAETSTSRGRPVHKLGCTSQMSLGVRLMALMVGPSVSARSDGGGALDTGGADEGDGGDGGPGGDAPTRGPSGTSGSGSANDADEGGAAVVVGESNRVVDDGEEAQLSSSGTTSIVFTSRSASSGVTAPVWTHTRSSRS
jgi:hypothetical protein